MLYEISKALEILEIHRKTYRGGVDEGILLDHCMSLTHGLWFLGTFLELSENEYLKQRIRYSVTYVNQKLYFFTHLRSDESLVMNLDNEYADLREQMKYVIIEPQTNENYVIYPDILTHDGITTFRSARDFLSMEIEKLVSLDWKAGRVTLLVKELEDIKKMLTSMEPFFEYPPFEEPSLVKEGEEEIFTTVADAIERATRFIYLSIVLEMDDNMLLYLKNCLSDLIIEETQVMKMYLILNAYSTGKIKSHISMSLKLLDWNKKCYLGREMGAALEEHFVSIKHGLQFLVVIHKTSTNKDLKLRIQHFVAVVKRKLYSLPNYQKEENLTVNQKRHIQHFVSIVKKKLYLLPQIPEDEILIVKLKHAYGELREEMQNVVFKPGTDEYDSLFPDIVVENGFSITKDLLQEKIKKLRSSGKANHIAPIMKELEELSKKLTSLEPLFDYVRIVLNLISMKENETKVMAALTTFFDRATCLIYMSFIGNLNEDMLVSLRKNLSLLIGETEIKEMSLTLGIIFEDDIGADFDISLSHLKMQEVYRISTINEAMLDDHNMSLKHGIEFLKWIPKLCKDVDMKQRIILLAANVKQQLESLTYKQGHESLNMDVNGVYAELREEMQNLIIKQETKKYDILFPENITLWSRSYLSSTNDFVLEKITTLVTSNCKADPIAPVKKELQDLQKMLAFFKPLSRYVDHEKSWSGITENIFTTLLTKSTFLIYLAFIGKMEVEMVLLLKRNISTMIKETDILEIYVLILAEVLHNRDYREEKLYFLENLILLTKSNVEYVNDPSSKLSEVLIDIQTFLLDLSPNVLLRKLHLLQASFQVILAHSIPIICSCYLEHIEVDISAELNCVLDKIYHIKSESQEIKLYYFPRTDDLGFLKFFAANMEDLIKTQESSMKEEIGALYFEVQSLLSLATIRNDDELIEAPWTGIMNMAYQAEYIIDLYLARSSKDLRLISSFSKIIGQLKDIRADVNDAITGSSYNLCKCLKAQDFSVKSTQLNANDAIMGLQVETRIIKEYLFEGEYELNVISIFGMAGVGKTTLALTLYKTPLVADHFDIRAWCTISQSYQNRDLLISILDQVNDPDKSHRSILDDEELADHFCRSLKKRRYLIILDDIWDTTLWNYLKRYLPDDRTCSRILITTRNRDVADQIGSKVQELHGLSNEKSWELFQKKMIDKESLPDYLQNISKGIVENCKGLPLSIVIIAGILSGIERTEETWNQIAESVSSFVLSDPLGKCKAILELSYTHLPNGLRSCFLYLGSFPENQEISVNHLIFRWIGEGLVWDANSYSAEEVGRKYMEDLIAKSLVIPSKERSRGGVKTFRLHDLLRDFCLDKAKEKHFFTVLDQRNHSLPLQDPRLLIMNEPHSFRKGLDFSYHSIRSMICYNGLDGFEIMKGITSYDMVLLKVLEVDEVLGGMLPDISSLVHMTYLALGLRYPEISVCLEHFQTLEVDEFCSKLFRVLGVDDVCPVFSSISSLVHLRYLNLGFWGEKISVLPSSISKLQKLQILILRSKSKYSKIKVPDFIWDMVKLRHVHITKEVTFEVDNNRLENSPFLLENLTSLSKARVSCGDSKWLSKLLGLQRLSCVFVDLKENEEGEEVDDKEDNQFRMLSFNSHLTSLKVENSPRKQNTCHFPSSLRKLTLLRFSLESNDISQIGRPLKHLEVFKIYSCYVPADYQWNVDDDDFPKLKVLKLRGLQVSKWIASENSFLGLEQLWLDSCNHLDEIPLDFGYLPNLRLISVIKCAPSIDDSAREIEKLQQEEQNTDLRVHIYPRKW